jgi:hypothetical protein
MVLEFAVRQDLQLSAKYICWKKPESVISGRTGGYLITLFRSDNKRNRTIVNKRIRIKNIEGAYYFRLRPDDFEPPLLDPRLLLPEREEPPRLDDPRTEDPDPPLLRVPLPER